MKYSAAKPLSRNCTIHVFLNIEILNNMGTRIKYFRAF